jgi:hypothetical protein
MSARAVLALCCALALDARAQKHPCESPVVPEPGEGASVVQAEHEWLRKTFGGGTLVGQAFGQSSDGKRRYDLLVWRKPDGQSVEVCFDVTTVFEETIRQVEEEEASGPRSPAR